MYDGWRGEFYPDGVPKRLWFEYYADHFDTVELNSTFYRLPTVAAVEGWAAAAPTGFEYAVKLGAFGSHRMKLLDAASWLPNHIDRVRRLGGSLGVTVVQLPPRWRRSAARLDEFLTSAGQLAPELAWAVELREPSWLHDDVFDVLRRHGAALVIHDLLPEHPSVITASWTYLRFHGPHAVVRPYCDSYGAARLRRWAERIVTWADDGVGVRAYFDNDIGAVAPRDAASLRRMIDRSRRTNEP